MRAFDVCRWALLPWLVLGCGRTVEIPATLGDECTTAVDCDDGARCNGAERCRAGRCEAGPAPTCGDGDPCTFDGCTEGVGCVHVTSPTDACGMRVDGPPPSPDAGVDVGPVPVPTPTPDWPLWVPGPAVTPDPRPEPACGSTVREIVARDQVALDRFAGVECVLGEVTVQFQGDLSPLSELRWVGSLSVSSAGGAVLPAFDQLQRVDGTLRIRADGPVALGGLRRLQVVGEELQIVSSTATELPGLDALTEVGQVDIEAPLSPAPSFSALRQVGGDLRLWTRAIDGLDVLEHVSGVLGIGPEVASLTGLARLRTTGGLRMRGNGGLDTLAALAGLEVVWGLMDVQANPGLQALGLDALSRVRGFDVRLNPDLSHCAVDALLARLSAHPLDAEATVCCNRGCLSCEAGACVAPGGAGDGQSSRYLSYYDNGYLELSPEGGVDPRVLEGVTGIAALRVRDFESLPPLGLRWIGYFEAYRVQTPDLRWLQGLEEAQQLRVVWGQHQRLAGLEDLHTVGSLDILGIEPLVDIGAIDAARSGSLRDADTVSVRQNAMLDACQAEALAEQLAVDVPEATVSRGLLLQCEGACVGPVCQSL